MRTLSFKRRHARRGGASMVEFALILPLLAAIILGILEFGRAMQVVEVSINAARVASRQAILPQADSNAELAATAEEVFSDHALPTEGLTTTVLVNGAEADVSTASRGDEVSVVVAIPFANVSVITPRFLGAFNVTGTSTMRKE